MSSSRPAIRFQDILDNIELIQTYVGNMGGVAALVREAAKDALKHLEAKAPPDRP